MGKSVVERRVRDLSREEKIQICKSKGLCLGCPLLIKNPTPLGLDHCLMRNSQEQLERLEIKNLEEILNRKVVG